MTELQLQQYLIFFIRSPLHSMHLCTTAVVMHTRSSVVLACLHLVFFYYHMHDDIDA